MSHRSNINQHINCSADDPETIRRKIKAGICIIPGDASEASYGYLGDDKPRYCRLHRTEEMINLREEMRKQQKG